MLGDPYVIAALILGWVAAVLLVVALFMGRDRMIDDIRRARREGARR